jgi:hypothetical protein
LRSAIKRVGALASLDLDELCYDLDPLDLGEPRDCSPLRLKSESAPALCRG